VKRSLLPPRSEPKFCHPVNPLNPLENSSRRFCSEPSNPQPNPVFYFVPRGRKKFISTTSRGMIHPTMSDPLQLLIIDDSEPDAWLMARAIESGGFAVHWERVDSPPVLEEKLDAQKWDVILSDYTMPHFNGLDALALWKNKNLDSPFIIVSGVIDDEKAVAAMKAGARDCIRKSNLGRLAPTIERELREAAQRRSLTQRYLLIPAAGFF